MLELVMGMKSVTSVNPRSLQSAKINTVAATNETKTRPSVATREKPTKSQNYSCIDKK